MAVRGLLPDIDVCATEKEVRSDIASVIKTFDDMMACCTTFDFEFIAASGKSLCVPARKEGFKWSGRALKNLAGNGQEYVRLTCDLEAISSSESELPVSPLSSPDATGES